MGFFSRSNGGVVLTDVEADFLSNLLNKLHDRGCLDEYEDARCEKLSDKLRRM